MDEQLIGRVRSALSLGMSLDRLVAHFTDEGISIEFVYLAYHAALILESDYDVS